MLDTVGSFVDFLSAKLNVSSNKFGIYRNNDELAEMGMLISDMVKEYGVNKPNVKEFPKSPNKDETLSYVEDYVTNHCNIPDGCFRFYDPPMTQLKNIQK